MEESDKQPVYQYYTIINDTEAVNNVEVKKENENQVVYLTFGGEDEEASTSESVIQTESDGLQTFASNVKIITLEDGRMFMTTSSTEEENFSTDVVPHLFSNCEQEQETETDNKNDDDSADGLKYEVIELFNNDYNVLKYTNNANNEEVKKEKKFHCFYEGCDKIYPTSYQLTVHLRGHMNCKPYECTMEGCDKKFSTNYSLKAHVRTHTGEKPYGCGVCEKHFKTSGDLQKHIRIHTGEKPFMCPFKDCGKSFTTSNIRKVHIRSHTGERPYTCDYPHCGKAFSSSTNYKNHIRIHSGEKPYVCNIDGCYKRFTEYSSLYKHNMVHQPNRPFTCAFCDQKFKQESAMNLHKRVKHNVILASDGTEIVVDLN